MTVTIDFTPQEEHWLNAETHLQGLSPAEILKRLVDQNISGFNETQTLPDASVPVISAKSAAAIAFLKRKLEEDATDDPAEIRKSEEEFEELLISTGFGFGATPQYERWPRPPQGACRRSCARRALR